MSERNYSLTGLNKFLVYASDKGLMKKETASGRKRAANQVLGILDDHELQDLRQVNLEATANRFAILQGSNFKPSSLQVYVSRTKSAVQDFVSYVDDPINFKSSVNARAIPTSGNGNKPVKKQNDSNKTTSAPAEKTTHNSRHENVRTQAPETLVFPVPIRPDLIVNIANIPSDLTETEAAKIAAVVKALATPSV